MPKFEVEVNYEMMKVITVYARDEQAACEKAVDIVQAWSGVITADATEAEEVE